MDSLWTIFCPDVCIMLCTTQDIYRGFSLPSGKDIMIDIHVFWSILVAILVSGFAGYYLDVDLYYIFIWNLLTLFVLLPPSLESRLWTPLFFEY